MPIISVDRKESNRFDLYGIHSLFLKFVRTEGLENKNNYHNLEHWEDVAFLAELFTMQMSFNVPPKEYALIVTKLAALFHDVGHGGIKDDNLEDTYIETAVRHFESFFEQTPEINQHRDADFINDDVIELIRFTRHPPTEKNKYPTNILQEIIADADKLAAFNDTYFDSLNARRRENRHGVDIKDIVFMVKVLGLRAEMNNLILLPSIDNKTDQKKFKENWFEAINFEEIYLSLLEKGINQQKEGVNIRNITIPLYTNPARNFFLGRLPLLRQVLDDYRLTIAEV